MLYYSTNHQSPKADFREATIRGQAPDKGLYFPEMIPALPGFMLNNLHDVSNEAIAFELITPYVGNTIPGNILEHIIAETINFPFPLVQVNENIFSLELFHGPTLAFKDVGARFMSRCLGYFVGHQNKEVTVLVATSGDTGGAVANGFLDVEGVNVVILYPSGKVSATQELQLTTNGRNITAIEVAGSFDDCQRMVKQAFADQQLQESLFLTSANSINVARWLPQQFYYAIACKQWREDKPPVVAVPSGNFGNICAGLLANASGLSIQHFIAACNANDAVHEYRQTGKYSPKPAVPTLSNAMDVGNPSNFVRILEIMGHEFPKFKERITTFRISDNDTREAISSVFSKHRYLLDPHGAVAYLSLKAYLENRTNQKGIFLATAHPVKFADVIEPLIPDPVALPESVKNLQQKKKMAFQMSADFESLKELLLYS